MHRLAPTGKRRARTRWVLAVAAFLSFIFAEPSSAAVLNSVQSNTAVLGAGATSAVVPISAVDLTKSFLVFSLRHGIADPQDSQVSGQITSPTSITFQRIGTTGTVTIEWSVVEFTSGVTVQRGSRLIDTATKNVTLSNVVLGNSFPIVSLRTGGTQWSDEDFVRARLTSATNLELSMYAGRIDAVTEWQVVEYVGAAVQTGDSSFAVGESSKSVSGLTNFDPNRAWLLYSYMNDTGTTNIAQKLVRGLITSPTSLQFDRDSTGQAVDLTWHLVEFLDTTVVQHANAGFSTAETSKDVTINAVDVAATIAVGGYGTRGGKTALTSTDRTGPGWFAVDITNSTTLRLSRGETQNVTADLGWFVVQFPSTVISGTVFEDVNYGGGIGRDLATATADAPSFVVGRETVTVELYDNSGSFVTSGTTAAGGTYAFDVQPGTYTVRVVNTTVTSSRSGSDGSELAVQTYRTDGVSEGIDAGAKKVGGELPSYEDAAANSGAQTLASLQGTDVDLDGVQEWTQSIVAVDASSGDVTGADFGFNFDVVVNTNDAEQGSLRQFILNANRLN